jgi:formylmethanofuran dehydrogenase subunit E
MGEEKEEKPLVLLFVKIVLPYSSEAYEMEENPRSNIEQFIEKGDLEALLRKAAELHGHFCSYLVYGVKAGYIAVKKLGIKNSGMEELIAIVETNNCFSDGVQVVTGCTFGNNGLIYKDVGKTAVTVAKRDGTAIRIALDPKYEESIRAECLEANNLWEKIVVRREPTTEEQQKRMMELFAQMAFNELRKPVDLMFRIKRMKIRVPDYAPIFDSIICPICGEKTYKPIMQNQKQLCIDCARTDHHILDGSGIRKYPA